MVWKALKEKSGITKHSSTGSHSSTFSVNMGKLPKKSCLRTAEDSLDSDWSNGGSSVSSQRSETVKCESSFISVPANSTISTRMSTHATESLDANVSKVSRVIEAPTMETTTRSTGSNTTYSEKCKSVRFSVVEIRDYAREVADNPSCSSGPPIGIGWTHLDSRVVHLNHYEHSRPYRKGQLELVLTREEREVLLAEWGVSTHDIVSSTRALIKAKNQRRQTVRNLNKAERVEESLENATRKLKRLFSLRKSTRVEVDKLQRQAEIAAALSPARFQESQESVGSDESGNGRRRASPSIPRPEIIEQDDGVLGPFDVKLGPLAGNGKISQHKVILNDDMDAISCISGFTLGNSTTASALEIERFHRELELELFGDQELPSMLGQTLEVNVDIPEEDKVFHDPSPICGTREPPSVVNESCYGESTLPSHYDCYNVNHECPPIHHSSPMHQLEQLHMPIQTSYENQCSDAYGNYQMQIGGHPQNYNFRLGGSLGSSIEANRQIQNGVEHQQQQSPFSLSQASTNYSTGSRWTDATPYSNRRDQNQFADGPMVSYMPLASHLSPNNWMEGSSNQLHGTTLQNPWDAVIISEDDLDEIQQHFMEQGPGMPYYL